jgi:hypothetical protein
MKNCFRGECSMTHYESDWVFNVGLKVAAAIFLATLAMGLVTGVTPVTAVFRSGAAFGVFVTIGWAAALVWEPPMPEEEAEETEEDEEKSDAEQEDQQFKPEPTDRLNTTQAAQQTT